MNNIVIKSYKIRIYPNKNQIKIINQTLGACRWIWNDYLAMNINNHKENKPFLNGQAYSKLLTQWKKYDPKYTWLNDISQKAILKAFMNSEESFKKFFKHMTGFPRFKSKKRNPVRGYYFITEKVKFKHNYVNLPILKWTKISENSYIPTDKRLCGGTIIKDSDDKYYITIRVYHRINDLKEYTEFKHSKGIGIDVGINAYVTGYFKDGNMFKISKFINDKSIVMYEEEIEKLQRIISNKMEVNYGKILNKYLDSHDGEEPNENQKNIMKAESYSNNCRRLQRKINRYEKKIHNYKKNKIDNLVIRLAKSKPKYITIEDLSVKNLLENNASSELHKYIQDSMFRYFYTKLIEKSIYYDIEIRQANKFFASSKICSNCGSKKKDLTLSDRIYDCPCCGLSIDRDLNAAINLCNLKKYTIIKPL